VLALKPVTEAPLVPEEPVDGGFVPPPDDLFAAEYAQFFNKHTVPAPSPGVAVADAPDTLRPDERTRP
jgi:hypothetical protein